MRRTDRERGQDFAWDVLKKAPYATLSMTDRQALCRAGEPGGG